MIHKRGSVLCSGILLLAVLGCNFFQALAGGGSPPPAPNSATPLPATPLRATETPQVTLTPSVTPSPTFTFTPSLPMVKVSVDTNCRTGPGKAYDVVGALLVGQTAQVVGQDGYGVNWIILNPNQPGGVCWLYAQYATVTGDWKSLPVATPPPTPTPAASFTFAYKSLGVGPGVECLQFSVKNTGSVTWESYAITINDSTQGQNGITSSDIFANRDAFCVISGSQPSLPPGASGTASGQIVLPHNPAGDHFDVKLSLCPGNGLGGPCMTQTIHFVFGP